MPTDTSKQTVEIAAPLDVVLAAVRDIEGQVTWVPQILEAEVLEKRDDGLPEKAHFKASATVGTDEYTLAYEHADTAITWSMVKGKMQTGQEGSYVLRSVDPGHTSVTYELTIHHNLPLPGFIRNRVIKGLVADALKGLKEHLEAGAGS